MVNGSKCFTGILLQSNVGALPAPNHRILLGQNLAQGPCDKNTISHRHGKDHYEGIKCVFNINFPFQVHSKCKFHPSQLQSSRFRLNYVQVCEAYYAPLEILLTYRHLRKRYTIVFRYRESLVNRNITFQQCPPVTPFATVSFNENSLHQHHMLLLHIATSTSRIT